MRVCNFIKYLKLHTNICLYIFLIKRLLFEDNDDLYVYNIFNTIKLLLYIIMYYIKISYLLYYETKYFMII